MQHVIFETSLRTLVTHGKNRKKIKKRNPIQYSLSSPRGDENSHPVCAKSMITWVHGTKRGGTHIYSDQTGWQTGPCGVPSSTHLVQNYHTSLLKYTRTRWLWTSAKPAKATFDLRWWEKGGTHACNPVRATPARLKWVPVAVLFWLGGIGKWICLQSHSQMNTGR